MGRFRGGGSRAAAPKKPALTHFICLPLVNEDSKPQLEKALQTFRQDITGITRGDSTTSVLTRDEPSQYALPRIHPKAIRPTGTLHLTLGVMSLNEDQLTQAIDHLAKLDLAAILSETGAGSTESQAIQDIKIDMRGLETMHAVDSTSILYAAPTDLTNRLYPFCVAVQNAFRTEGFLDDDRKLKLHATLINTIYAKSRKKPEKKPAIITLTGEVISSSSVSNDRSHDHGPIADVPLEFDAGSILDKYQDHIWANSILLDRISICEMGAKKITDSDGEVIDECYTEVASIRMPAFHPSAETRAGRLHAIA